MNGRERLSAWIARHTTQADFARKAGISPPHLTLVLQGKRGVSLAAAKRIQDETAGAVPMDSLVGNRGAA